MYAALILKFRNRRKTTIHSVVFYQVLLRALLVHGAHDPFPSICSLLGITHSHSPRFVKYDMNNIMHSIMHPHAIGCIMTRTLHYDKVNGCQTLPSYHDDVSVLTVI